MILGTSNNLNKSYGTMRHVRSCKNTRDTPSASAAETASAYTAPSASAADRPTAARSRRVDSGSRQTLLVLQFVIEFANIWAQYCPSIYESIHVCFFWFVP